MELYVVRYAQSLFDLAIEENALSSFHKTMNDIKDFFDHHEEGFRFIAHDNIPNQVKKELIQQLLPTTNEYILNFMKLLIDRKRIKAFPMICLAFHSLANQHLGVEEGVVYSAQKLTKDEVNRIELAVSQKMNVKVELANQIDEGLIAGVKVVVRDTVYDDTLGYRLNEMKNQILQGKK